MCLAVSKQLVKLQGISHRTSMKPIFRGGLRLGGCQAMPKAAADHKSSDAEGGTWSWLHAVHVPEGHRSMREICLSWHIMA